MVFRQLLMQVGFTNAQATAFINEGIREPRDLSTYTHSDLKGLFKHLGNREIHPPYMAQHRVQTCAIGLKNTFHLDCRLGRNISQLVGNWNSVGRKYVVCCDTKDNMALHQSDPKMLPNYAPTIALSAIGWPCWVILF
jgi:hypothetical protein